MMMGHPWMSPFAQYPMYFNNYMVKFKDLFISIIAIGFYFMFMLL
jgi:hypothetical protein